jgi:chromosome partitioning protein
MQPLTLTFTSWKGGVTKTTAAMHVAAELQKLGDVLLIDADPNESAIGWASRQDPGKLSKIPFAVAGIHEVAGVLAANSYNYQLVDTQAHPSDSHLTSMARSSALVILPVSPTTLDVASLKGVIQVVESVGKPYRVLISKVNRGSSTICDRVKGQLAAEDILFFSQEISMSSVFDAATAQGAVVSTMRGGRGAARRGAEEYAAITQEILEIVNTTAPVASHI